MKHNAVLLIRGVILMAAVMLLIMTANMFFDLNAMRYSFVDLFTLNASEARHLSNALNRNFNQLVAVAFTTVAIAVPLTANLYSLKFVEFFIKDRVNTAVLTFVVFASLNNTWVAWGIKDNFVPVFQLHLSLLLVITGFAVLFPYLYYVFRFLHPHTLVVRMEEEVIQQFHAAVRHPRRAAHYAAEVAEGIENLSNITVRSIDRLDRSTAIESILSIGRLLRAYWPVKEQMAPAWFVANDNFFLGFSSPAVEEFTQSRNWVEMKFFYQMRQVMRAAISKTHDVISVIAKTFRRLGSDEAARRDASVCEMVMEYFNTFVRFSIQHKDARSVFIIFDEYRNFVVALNKDFPDLALEIAYYFEYYGGVARDNQMTFVVESIAHDLGAIVRHAWENQAPNREKLLERFLHYDSQAKLPLPGVKKAQALLASYFLQTDHREPVNLIRKSFIGLDQYFIQNIADDLMHVKREKYWEINERRMNMDFTPAAQREKLQQFFADLPEEE